MKEAIGNAALFNIVIIFVAILIAFFVGSLSYSKAYKVKNKIVEEIEKEGEHSTTVEQAENAYNNAVDEINEWLASGNNGQGIGYRLNTNGGANNTANCSSGNLVNKTSDYEYCVYMHSTCSEDTKGRCGVYYTVTTYMYFDVPIIEDLVRIPIHGETMTFTINNN